MPPAESLVVVFRTNIFLQTGTDIFREVTGGVPLRVEPGNTKGGSISVPLTSCLTGLESAV